ncbi:unnamed protein product, partial [marine sediment metagenome]
FPVGAMKNIFYKLLGMKIGKNTLIGGVIKDPCVTEFGDNVTMGEYSIIYGHIQDYSKGIITINRIIIGNNCQNPRNSKIIFLKDSFLILHVSIEIGVF